MYVNDAIRRKRRNLVMWPVAVAVAGALTFCTAPAKAGAVEDLKAARAELKLLKQQSKADKLAEREAKAAAKLLKVQAEIDKIKAK